MIPIAHTPLPDAPSSASTPVVIFDPHVADDARFISDLVTPAYPALRKIEVPYAGHTVLQFLANEKVISRVMRALIGEDEIVAFTAEGRENPIWHFNRAKSLRGKDPAAALAHYQKSIDLAPSPQSIGPFLTLCMQRNMLDAAQTMIDWTQTQESPNSHIPPAIAERAAEMGLRLNAA
ncbi:hypothetical protein [Ketogulonicigenium robustum]|nr:hypothetical protein [Ketogulonicigenium robustum]